MDTFLTAKTVSYALAAKIKGYYSYTIEKELDAKDKEIIAGGPAGALHFYFFSTVCSKSLNAHRV